MSTDIVICILYALQLRIYRTTYIHECIHTHALIEAIFYFLFTEQFLASFYLHFFTFPLLHFAHSSADSKRSTAKTNIFTNILNVELQSDYVLVDLLPDFTV